MIDYSFASSAKKGLNLIWFGLIPLFNDVSNFAIAIHVEEQ